MSMPVNSVPRMMKRDVEQTETCWLWRGPLHVNGYGKTAIQRKTFLAHRVFYQHFHGPIPEGKQIDHLCKNRACVNPAHLEAVEPAENNARSDSPSAVNSRKTECVHGHSLIDPYITPDGRRQCRACMRARAAKWAAKKVPRA